MRRSSLLPGLLISAQAVAAQDSSGNKQEVWPEANLFYRVNDKFRVFALYSTTKLKNSSYTDGGSGIYLDYFTLPWLRRKWSKQPMDSTLGYYLWLRAGYLHSATRKDAVDPFEERTLVTEANLRFHLPYAILLTNKNRIDFRFVDGIFTPRYRIKSTFEKDMRTEYLQFTPYIYGEYFLELNKININKFRLCGGAELRVARHVNFETYILYQFRDAGSVQDLTAVGIALKFYLDHRQLKERFSKKAENN